VSFDDVLMMDDTELSEAAEARGVAMRTFIDEVLGGCEPQWGVALYAAVSKFLRIGTAAERVKAAEEVRAARAPALRLVLDG
jgi:hypothetical protein